jgi:three-Cys-motif partner protein
MEWSENYEDRPQSFVKHFFLEKYLEKLAFHILWRQKTLVYVDAFSGPWMSSDASYKDTSFAIAARKLRGVHGALKSKHGKDRKIKFLFIEEDDEAFGELESYVNKISDLEAKAIHGRFEDNIADICDFIGKDFSFTFVDPKGWSGANPSVLEPILRLEGEVLINFMYDFVNRFLHDEREGVQRSLRVLFPEIDAEREVQSLEKLGLSREDAILELYKRSIFLKSGSGSPSLVTSLAVKNRRAERTHFHLVYRTRASGD